MIDLIAYILKLLMMTEKEYRKVLALQATGLDSVPDTPQPTK